MSRTDTRTTTRALKADLAAREINPNVARDRHTWNWFSHPNTTRTYKKYHNRVNRYEAKDQIRFEQSL
jgi:hypothetical protein